jgi:hypothetical protein
VYLEGTDIGYNNSTTDIWPYLGITYDADGNAYSTGNVQTLTGRIMASGLTYGYPYQTMPDNYVDEFGPGSGDLVFICQAGEGRVGCYSGSTGAYRTITSSVVFSAIQDGTYTKAQLMDVYMEYLTGGTGTGDTGSMAVEHGWISVANPSYGRLSVTLELSCAAQCDLGVYDLTGRRMGTLAGGDIPQGTHTLVLDEELACGSYLVSGRIAGTTVTERVVLLR